MAIHRATKIQRRILKWSAALLLSALLVGTVSAWQKNADQADSKQQSSQKDTEKKDKQTDATVKLKILVLSDKDKPIGNASVYVRFNQPGGLIHKDKLVELNLKTNQDGSVKVPEIPQGQIMIQVVASGWHTYGKWYDIQQDEDLVRINLAPPPHLY